MLNLTKYKLHPEALKIMKEISAQVDDGVARETKDKQVADFVFISLYMYSQRIGRDQEHIEYLSKVVTMNTLELTNSLGAIDKYQKEIGV